MTKPFKFVSSRVCYEDMEITVHANSEEEALEVAKDKYRDEDEWTSLGIGQSEYIDSNNIRRST